jgi:hypothetical protein
VTRKAALLALLLAAVLVAAGCDPLASKTTTAPEKTLSHAQLVHAANRACVRFVRRLKHSHFTANTSFPKREKEEQTILIPAYERLLFVLHGLAPPPADAAAYRKLLATFNYLDLTVHQFFNGLDAAVANRDRSELRRLRRLERRVIRLGNKFNSRAKSFGLHRCA